MKDIECKECEECKERYGLPFLLYARTVTSAFSLLEHQEEKYTFLYVPSFLMVYSLPL